MSSHTQLPKSTVEHIEELHKQGAATVARHLAEFHGITGRAALGYEFRAMHEQAHAGDRVAVDHDRLQRVEEALRAIVEAEDRYTESHNVESELDEVDCLNALIEAVDTGRALLNEGVGQ